MLYNDELSVEMKEQLLFLTPIEVAFMLSFCDVVVGFEDHAKG